MSTQCQDNVTIKVSTEFPVAIKHRRDMTEKKVQSVVKPEQTTTKQLICNRAPAIYPRGRGEDSGGNVPCRFLPFIVPAAPRGCRVFVFERK